MNVRFEKLKTELFMHGAEAISDFLGYDYPLDEEKDVTDSRLDEVYEQMPDDEMERYYKKYAIPETDEKGGTDA